MWFFKQSTQLIIDTFLTGLMCMSGITAGRFKHAKEMYRHKELVRRSMLCMRNVTFPLVCACLVRIQR